MVVNLWQDKLEQKILSTFGEAKGKELIAKYLHAFPHNYLDDYSVETAVEDIQHIEELSDSHPIEISFFPSQDKTPNELDLRLYQWHSPIPLSDILPMVENLDLKTINERPHKISLNRGQKQTIWISDFTVSYKKPLDLDKANPLFEDAFISIYTGKAENDGFNKLVLNCLLGWREISVIRMYAKYLRQVGFRFTQQYIEKALTENACISKDLVAFFFALNDPSRQATEQEVEAIESRLLKTLESVSNLDEDRIIRKYIELIKTTLRTNYFQKTEDGKEKEYIAIKLSSRLITDLPLPTPLYEVFVYSPRFEAVHLRNTKVARGGIRWSDRAEDFRTEILGLMKAQTVKNSVIIPSGAKGGFVLKMILPGANREEVLHEVIACYTAFICGLLDLTDNIVNNKYISPPDVICHDEVDYYLVVAADKGTSNFSDLANDISNKYNFWLGDAFASGGKTGYDHKKMGITARGAWESIKRHFREFHIDAATATITVAGIGDMSGDVFGNGMLYSKYIKMVAAFDHRDIFIDPSPNPETSYNERLRLYKLPLSSWQDYNRELISKGGGVFKRSLKSIPLSKEMKELLKVNDDAMMPNDLIQAILKAPVDLLYNGGIGTYVKASTESNAQVGDRTNDYCRINGNEVRARVVAEGGNLGFTQLARVEYSLVGGIIFTDFIDNSAGVDCSDHEVNLKILLDEEVKKGRLSEEDRNKLLFEMTHEVAELVLHDNYEQALVLSFIAETSPKNISLHTTYIKELETMGVLDRHVEFLPEEKELIDRKASEKGLTRPELAVLLAYSKIYIKHKILKTHLPEDPYLHHILETAFPEAIRKKYSKAMDDHRLHRDIIATQLSNKVVNQMGMTFIYRMQVETGATIDEIIRAFTLASEVFDTNKLEKLVTSLDFKIPLSEQYEMLYHIRHLLNLATRWFLHTNFIKQDLGKTIDHFSSRIKSLEPLTPTLMSGFTKEYLNKLTDKFLNLGVPTDIAKLVATYRAIYTMLNVVDVATKHDFDLEKTARVYFACGEKINLVWFRDQISSDSRGGHWNVLARLTLRDELDMAQRELTVAIINTAPEERNEIILIEKWMNHNERALKRWERVLGMLHSSSSVDYTMFFIAVRELIGVIMMSKEPVT